MWHFGLLTWQHPPLSCHAISTPRSVSGMKVGDAQASHPASLNWRSWSEGSFTDGTAEVTVKDLLGRTVLYKVGHHGSHNATLNGKASPKYASLAWMAQARTRRNSWQ